MRAIRTSVDSLKQHNELVVAGATVPHDRASYFKRLIEGADMDLFKIVETEIAKAPQASVLDKIGNGTTLVDLGIGEDEQKKKMFTFISGETKSTI